MKKKVYQQPKVKIVELEQTDIICTSPSGEKTETPTLDPHNETYEF